MTDEFEIRDIHVVLTRANPEDLDSLEVRVYPNDSPEKAIEYARGEIQRTRWWLQDYWLEKDLPHEQIEFTDGKHSVTLYNYSGNLSPEQLATISRVLGIFSAIKKGVVFDHLRYILIDDSQEIYSKTGKPKNGLARSDWRAIIIYPNAFSDQPSEMLGQISHLEWTVTHEFSHLLEEIKTDDQDSFIDGWKRVGKWRVNRQGRTLPGGGISIWETDDPQRCVTERAHADYQEDLAESNTARIYAPDKLDPQKVNYLQQRIPFNREEQRGWDATRISAAEIKLPETPREFKIKMIQQGKRPTVVVQNKE